MSRLNHLAEEKSPYLRQHAHNPVNWYPWCPRAFRKAKKEDKPIFLSIGYSTCHWCHVMAGESFEDKDMAGLMNETFVNIKVDREERPDLDSIYMKVCQMMTGSGGWPLTIIMTPDKKPFFAGTYIPKENRFGRVGMKELVPRIGSLWKDSRRDLIERAEMIVEEIQNGSHPEGGGDLDETVLEEAYGQLLDQFDEIHGGFGTKPKFPSPHNLLFLLRYWHRSGSRAAMDMVTKTIRAMRNGGIFDQLGFGFHRYSTYEAWLIPHFEKMLYDQAMLALTYLEAYQATGQEEFASTAEEVFTYMLREMRSPEGAFFSAQDADVDGEEGAYYTWTQEEIQEILGEDAEIAFSIFGVEAEGNFSQGETGENVLHLEPGARDGVSAKVQDEIRKKLLEAREDREKPETDHKILTDWNGLAIAALARGAWVLNSEEYLHAARKAADFIIGTMLDEDGKLMHRYGRGEAGIDGTLDDYAFLAWGLMELYEADFEAIHIENALGLVNSMLEHFWDPEGGLFLTPDYVEAVLTREKKAYDGSIPSGNSVALLNMLRLSRMTGKTELDQKAWETVGFFSGQVRHSPAAYSYFLSALDFALAPGSEVVITGSLQSEGTERMLDKIRDHYLPSTVILHRPGDPEDSGILELAPHLRDIPASAERSVAYVCTNFTCGQPISDPERLIETLQDRGS